MLLLLLLYSILLFYYYYFLFESKVGIIGWMVYASKVRHKI